MDERRLTIIFPGLFDLVASRHRTTFPAECPNLARLFDRSLILEDASLDFETAIANALGGTSRENGETSAVELSAAIDDIPFCQRLVRADPVHMRADGARVRLFSGSMFEPSAAESVQLIDELKKLFPEYEFFIGKFPGRWYVRLPETLEFSADAPTAIQQLAIEECLPTGVDAPKIHALMNELQMALHQSVVNQEREARRLPAINSVWLWGCDKRLSVQRASKLNVWGNDILTYALSQRHGLMHTAIDETPFDSAEVLQQPWVKAGKLVLFNHPTGPIGERRTEIDLDHFEHAWVEALLNALRTRRVKTLEVVDMRRKLRLESSDAWKFWRRSNYFSERLKIDIDPNKLPRDVPIDGS